jgi:hypothetical protein
LKRNGRLGKEPVGEEHSETSTPYLLTGLEILQTCYSAMAEITAYLRAILGHRALLLNDEITLEGAITVSIETAADLGSGDGDVPPYIGDHFPDFFRGLRFLSRENQDMLFADYVLDKTQTRIARLRGTTQTLCSSNIRMALKKIGSLLMYGPSTARITKPVFVEFGLEHKR